MRKYVVKGTILKDLLEKVSKHFDVDISNIKYEILRRTPMFEVKVWVEEKKDILVKETFEIELRDEGIFLIVKKVDDVKTLTLKRILKEIEERKIKDVDIEAIESSLYKLNSAVKIADFDKEYYIDSIPTIEILNNMEATIKLSQPKRGRDATVDSILALAEEKGIMFGLRKKALNIMIKEKIYNQKVILAKGKDVIHGKDAYIKYTYQPDKSHDFHPHDKENKVNGVNFKELDWIINVSKDEIIAQKIPLVYGEDGIDIYGKTIPAKEPKDITINPGKNTYVDEDGLSLKCEIDGQLVQKGKTLSVDPLLLIPSNVDYSTGNIDFNGTVIIKGNVLSGFSVKAQDDIYVEGLVEDAELIANGKIVINNGILGNEEFLHTIYAKEGVKALFIQHMNIKSDGPVEVNRHILHSFVESGKSVVVTEGTGKIIGGEIKAQWGIECNIAGGPFETPTKLILDVFSNVIKEESEINKEMLILEENRFKIENFLKDTEHPLKNSLGSADLTQEEGELFKQLAAINNKYVVLQSKRSEIEERRRDVKSNSIKIMNRIYPGVIIKIGRELFLNRSEKIKTIFCIDPETNDLVER